MQHHNTSATARTWYDSGHASLCLLRVYLRRMVFFKPLEAHVQIQQKVLKYTPVVQEAVRCSWWQWGATVCT